MSTAGPITRVTMIKIPSDEHQAIALVGFTEFAKTQQKNGVPYILSMQAGAARGSARDQGYTLVTKSVFRNIEDMQYYETDCPAHNRYREFLKKNAPVESLMAVYFVAEAGFDI
ncbi:hypothetical protein FE257_006922 [Aspergillus nanangensis]|uniref:Stress-response A/B barrel domain-containing protein n=1 Tax=Aspergillus nanangensis TaxID=2582783 RepID=A0AAD4CQE0_ASPNN|nr:hypothetical protein FE257_006922 [Aspergillus nanangensis]